MMAPGRGNAWRRVGLVLPAVLLAALSVGILPDRASIAPHEHFVIVSAVSVLSSLFAVLVLAAAVQIADLRVLALALAFLCLSGLFAVHGLATPGVIAPGTYLALFSGAWFLAASTLESRIAVHRQLLRYRRRIVSATLAVLSAYGTIALIDLVLQRAAALGRAVRPSWLGTVERGVGSTGSGSAADALGGATIALLALALVHY
jgi:hypothetical protein